MTDYSEHPLQKAQNGSVHTAVFTVNRTLVLTFIWMEMGMMELMIKEEGSKQEGCIQHREEDHSQHM